MDFKINYSGTGHRYTQEEVDLVVEVMNSADPLTQGKHRNAFEDKFAAYLGVTHAFTTNNATSALELAAQLCQFEEGDEVICPSHTFTATLYPFLKKGARVKWADIDFETHVVNADTLRPLITDRTKAIIVVHLYGYMADMESIMALAQIHGIKVVEDNAQALGTIHNNRYSGSYGDFSVFSFHSHKNITTLGEGGMLVVKDPEAAQIVPMLRHNGHKPFDFEQEEYWLPAMGDVGLPRLNDQWLWPNNFCLGEVECALGAKLLDRLPALNDLRRKRAIRFIDELAEFDNIHFHRVDSERHNYHHLMAFFPKNHRDDFMRQMAYEHKIKCIVPYYPLNHNALYKELGFESGDCKNADKFFRQMCSFPFHSWLSEEDLEYMLECTKLVLRKLS